MRSLVQALIVATVVLFSGVGASALAGPTVPSGAPIVAQYSSGSSYGNSSYSSSSSSTRIPRGLIRLVVGVIVLVVSGIGVLIRKMSS
jgi:hypothetical protein